jgi:hypothetical protein
MCKHLNTRETTLEKSHNTDFHNSCDVDVKYKGMEV